MDNNQKIFKMHCKNCKKETVGVVSRILRSKGIKLRCVDCQTEQRGWKSMKSLKEYDFEEENDKFDKEKENNQPKMEEKEIKHTDNSEIIPKIG